MKRFACGDVVPDCQARFEGHDDTDILGQVAWHAAADHGLTEVRDRLVAEVVRNIATQLTAS